MLTGSAANQASRLIEELRITDPADICVDDIAWERNALVHDASLETAAARLVVLGAQAIITVSTKLKDPRQRAFAVAHELGHLELHRAANDIAECMDTDLDFRSAYERNTTTNREQEANSFAGALLMPDRLFTPRIGSQPPSMQLVESLAKVFPASFTATALRYVKLAKEACAIVYAREGRIRWYVGSRDFEGYHHVRVREPLDPYSIAYDFFDGKTLPNRMTDVDVSCWLAPRNYREDALLKEDTRGFPRQNATLSLLWIDRDIEREWEPSESFTPDGRYGRRRLRNKLPDR